MQVARESIHAYNVGEDIVCAACCVCMRNVHLVWIMHTFLTFTPFHLQNKINFNLPKKFDTRIVC